MTELELNVIAMAPITKHDGSKEWLVYGKKGQEIYRLVLSLGDDQQRLIDADMATAMELPCG